MFVCPKKLCLVNVLLLGAYSVFHELIFQTLFHEFIINKYCKYVFLKKKKYIDCVVLLLRAVFLKDSHSIFFYRKI